MTNLTATLTLVLATNWSGHNFQGKELGYIVTNHIATVKYGTNRYPMTMQVTPSKIAVWRPIELYLFTNSAPVWNLTIITNYLQNN